MSAAGTQDVRLADPADRHPHGEDCRCLCGNLLARVVGDQVELKCRRCKRTLLVPLAAGSRSASAAGKVAPPRRSVAR